MRAAANAALGLLLVSLVTQSTTVAALAMTVALGALVGAALRPLL